MKIVLNEFFKDDEAVLYCGKNMYAKMQETSEPSILCGIIRTWTLSVIRKRQNRVLYIHVYKRRATLVGYRKDATEFATYREAEDMAKALMDTGSFACVNIAEKMVKDIETDAT